MKPIIYFSLLVLLGCSHQPQTIIVFGEKIRFPAGVDESRRDLRLDRSMQGRFYRVDSESCQIVCSHFPALNSMDSVQITKATIWGYTISVDTSQMNLTEVVTQVEKESRIPLTYSTAFIEGTGYYMGSKGAIDMAIRKGGRWSFTMSADRTIAKCIAPPRTESRTITIYLGYGLSTDEFRTYLLTDGTNIHPDD